MFHVEGSEYIFVNPDFRLRCTTSILPWLLKTYNAVHQSVNKSLCFKKATGKLRHFSDSQQNTQGVFSSLSLHPSAFDRWSIYVKFIATSLSRRLLFFRVNQSICDLLTNTGISCMLVRLCCPVDGPAVEVLFVPIGICLFGVAVCRDLELWLSALRGFAGTLLSAGDRLFLLSYCSLNQCHSSTPDDRPVCVFLCLCDMPRLLIRMRLTLKWKKNKSSIS